MKKYLSQDYKDDRYESSLLLQEICHRRRIAFNSISQVCRDLGIEIVLKSSTTTKITIPQDLLEEDPIAGNHIKREIRQALEKESRLSQEDVSFYESQNTPNEELLLKDELLKQGSSTFGTTSYADNYDDQERAAILEFDAGLSCEEAEKLVQDMVVSKETGRSDSNGASWLSSAAGCSC
jgi:hypothetical protein